MTGRENSEELKKSIIAGNSLSPDTPSTSSLTISNYSGSKCDADDHNTPETNLNVSILLLS